MQKEAIQFVLTQFSDYLNIPYNGDWQSLWKEISYEYEIDETVDCDEKLCQLLINESFFGRKLFPSLPEGVSEQELHAFYSSVEWKKLRKETLEYYGNRCHRCNSTDDVAVDHIKSLRRFWNLRLEKDNLQLLCKKCNQHKGSIFIVDYRT